MLLKKSRYLVLGLSCLTIFSAKAFCADGGTSGGGGDSYSLEFVSLAYNIISTLKTQPIAGIDLTKLARAVATTRVNSKALLTLNGNLVDAINYPDAKNPRIEISRSGWDHLIADPAEKMSLVLHEYLGILRVDDRQYQISHKLGRQFEPPASSDSISRLVVSEISGTSIPWAPSKRPRPITIFAGTAGTIPSGSVLNPNSTFDTCRNPASPGLVACNDARIHPALNLKIRFKSKTVSGNTLITISNGAASFPVVGFISTPASAGAWSEVSISWGNLCSSMTNAGVSGINADCTTAPGSTSNAAIIILNMGVTVDGVDFNGGDGVSMTVIVGGGMGQQIGSSDLSTTTTCSNAEGSPAGLCQFGVEPGNGQVRLNSFALGASSGSGGRPFRKARLLWAEGDGVKNSSVFGAISSASPHKDLDFSPGGASISPDFVKGFKNDKSYTFKIAVVDELGNVGYYSNSTPAIGDVKSSDQDCSGTFVATDYECHVATPSR